MPLLRAFENKAMVSETKGFVLTEARLQECNAETNGDFDAQFLNFKEPFCKSSTLQLYVSDREAPADEAKWLLNEKLCITPVQLYQILKPQAHGKSGWLPTENEDLRMVFFMRNKTHTVREMRMYYSQRYNVWRVSLAADSDQFPAFTFFIAEGNALA